MIINDIKFLEKKNIFEVTLDEIKLNISYEIYEKYRLKKDIEISDDILDILIAEDLFVQAKEIALRNINYSIRSTFEIKNKLKQKKIPENIINKTTNYLVDKGYLNDLYYAKEFIRQCLESKNLSVNFTKQKLYEKGISKNIYEQILEKYDLDFIEENNCKIVAEKKSKNLDLTELKDYQKAYRYLISKGFNYNLCKLTLNRLKSNG